MNYKKASDIQLWHGCRKDDLHAYNELFRRQSPKLYKQAARYIQNDNAAEELMLDLLFDIWDKRQQRNIEGDLSAYLYRCMRNMIVDYRRKIIPDTISIEQTTLYETLEDQEQSDHLVMTADAEELYKVVLNKMSPQRRRVFQLSREANLTYSEIAGEMNLSVNTVENYMSSALELFRRQTKEYTYILAPIFLLSAGATVLFF